MFKPKRKQVEVIFVEENIIMLGNRKYHPHDHELQEIKKSLSLIIKTLNKMGDNLKELKQQIADASSKADKIAADVKALHDKIDGIGGETPTAEEWADIKSDAKALNDKLQGIDDQTPE